MILTAIDETVVVLFECFVAVALTIEEDGCRAIPLALGSIV